jgi:hypothetical protein
MVPTFTTQPLDGGGVQLCPCGLATPTPQTFSVAFLPATSTGSKVARRSHRRACTATQPRSVRFELVGFT